MFPILDGEGSYFNDYFNWRNIPQFSKLVKESPAAHIAAQLMGSEMRCCNNNTFYVNIYWLCMIIMKTYIKEYPRLVIKLLLVSFTMNMF